MDWSLIIVVLIIFISITINIGIINVFKCNINNPMLNLM